MRRLMSELIVRQGCLLYSEEIHALLPDSGALTHDEFAEILVQAEGLAPYEIGTRVHVKRIEMFKSKIGQHFADNVVSVDEVRSWTGE